MMEYEITPMGDGCHTQVTVVFGGREATFRFLHHENRKVETLGECFAFIMNSANRYEYGFTAEDYLFDNFAEPYTDEQILTAKYEAVLWELCWRGLRILFDEETIDLLDNIVDCI